MFIMNTRFYHLKNQEKNPNRPKKKHIHYAYKTKKHGELRRLVNQLTSLYIPET